MTSSAPAGVDTGKEMTALLVIGSIRLCAPDMGVN